MSILKDLREEKGIKQEELAKLLRVSPASYSKKEAGQVKFSLYEAKEISNYFKLSIDEIFFNNEVSNIDT